MDNLKAVERNALLLIRILRALPRGKIDDIDLHHTRTGNAAVRFSWVPDLSSASQGAIGAGMGGLQTWHVEQRGGTDQLAVSVVDEDKTIRGASIAGELMVSLIRKEEHPILAADLAGALLVDGVPAKDLTDPAP